MAHRPLPGHIAAALAGSGGAADSAGVAWDGRDLSESADPVHNFAEDDGASDPSFLRAVDELIAGTGSEADVVATLASARVFVPVVAERSADDTTTDGAVADKQADMALVTLTGPDGRSALPVFTSVERLQRWHPQARPVAVYAPRAALSAVSEEAQLVVVDPGAELTFVVRRPAVWALAQQRTWEPSYRQEAIRTLVAKSTANEPAVVGVRVEPGAGIRSRSASGADVDGGGVGPELCLVLTLVAGLDRDMIEQLVNRLQGVLAADQTFVDAVDSLEVKLAQAAG